MFTLVGSTLVFEVLHSEDRINMYLDMEPLQLYLNHPHAHHNNSISARSYITIQELKNLLNNVMETVEKVEEI